MIEIYTLTLIRGLFGFLVGFFAPIAATILTETIPTNFRGISMVAIN